MGLITFLDADYRADAAVTAVIGVEDWSDAVPAFEAVVRAPHAPLPYEPGAFYRRELPGLLAALSRLPPIDVAVIDGYVWLARGRPGLGAHLHRAGGGAYAVVGVAKTPFRDNDCAVELLRGGSTRPLYVTAEGMDARAAAACVARMDGPHRLPTLLKRVDRLARDA